MTNTIYKGKHKDHDLTVTVRNPGVVDGLVLAIEKAAIKQVPLSMDLRDKFCELRDVGFFTPYEGVAEPETGGIEPNGWSFSNYAPDLFANVKADDPFWIRDVSNASDPKKRFNFYIEKWARLNIEACYANSQYQLYRLIYEFVTRNETAPIDAYQAPSAMEVLRRILPEKYKIGKRKSS